MNPIREYFFCLFDKEMMPIALKVSVVVGSILFIINHGSALAKNQMNQDRWRSAGFTYLIPYRVNIQGQYMSRKSKS